jgi:hypothetical protein
MAPQVKIDHTGLDLANEKFSPLLIILAPKLVL